MSNKPLGLTRNQLAEFLPNARAVRAFEQLLEQVSNLLPSDVETLNRLINESFIEASTASARSDQALDSLARISRSLELLANAPLTNECLIPGNVLPQTWAVSLLELSDASIKLPVSGDTLSYDSTLRVWKNTATASIAVEIHSATSKVTPVDADELPIADSASTFSLKKLTWANLKATLATWLQGGNISSWFTTVQATTTIGVGGTTPSASGAGVSFPATQSASTNANTLDDYEEGTFTPTLVGATIPGVQTYVAQVGRYTKIGRLVTVSGLVQISAKDVAMAGSLRIGGLPFPAAALTNGFEAAAVASYQGFTFGAGLTQLGADFEQTASYIRLFASGSGAAPVLLTATSIAASTYLIFSGSYTTST